MRRLLLACVAFFPVVLNGCLFDHDCFQIEIKPEGDAYQRTLTCWHVGGQDNKLISSLRASQIAQTDKLYAKPPTRKDGRKYVFAGRFHESTPNDVGGAGSYTHFASSLGSASCYVERFRGDDDLASQVSKRLEKANRLADILAGWMSAELGNDPNFPRLKTFLDVDLRRDLRNLAVYACAGGVTSDAQSDSGHEWLLRAAQYFSERGYFSPREVPSLARAFNDWDSKPLLCHIQRLLCAKWASPTAVQSPPRWPFWAIFRDWKPLSTSTLARRKCCENGLKQASRRIAVRRARGRRR